MQHDRLNIYQKMVNGGVPEPQASAHAQVYGQLLEVVATKDDLNQAKTELEGKIEQTKTELESKIVAAISSLETRLTKWMLATTLSSAALIIAFLRLVPG